MPRFCANLSMLFTEVDFLERFDAAAKAGFAGVEYLFPYDVEAEAIKARLEAVLSGQAASAAARTPHNSFIGTTPRQNARIAGMNPARPVLIVP